MQTSLKANMFLLYDGAYCSLPASSCSGRLAVYMEKALPGPPPTVTMGQPEPQHLIPSSGARDKKKGGGWLMVSHDKVEVPETDDGLVELLFQGQCQGDADPAAQVC